MIRLFDTHAVRLQRELNGLWKLHRPDETEQAGTCTAMIPGCWEMLRGWENYRGRGEYTREIITGGGNLRLVFGGVSHTADVFWDGQKVAHHYNAFTPFDVVLTDVAAGSHTLSVCADNRYTEDSALHIPNDYHTYGGITRPVALEELGDAYIRFVHVTPIRYAGGWMARITAEVRRLSGADSVGLRMSLCGVETEDTLTFDENGTASLTRTVAVPDVREWTPEDPQLYTITACLTDENGHPTDDLIERFGFREIRTEGTKILLNGRPLLVKGFNRHEDYGIFGCAVPENAMHHDLEIIRSTGANLIRTCHYPNDQRFLDLCDEYGMLVWEEAHARGLSLERMQNPNFRRQSADCIAEMVEHHYNHPSIVFWGILNECAAETEYGRDCYAEQFAQLRSLDKTRLLTTATCKHFSDLTYGMPDVVSLNLYPQWYSGNTPVQLYEKIKAYLDQHGGAGKPILISECGAGAVYGYRGFSEVKWTEDYQAKLLADLIDAYTTREDISGIILWQYADCRVDEEWFASRPKTQNNKGIVDMYRRPKMGYYTVRDMFTKLPVYREEK